MPLVDYSSSGSEPEESKNENKSTDNAKSLKRKRSSIDRIPSTTSTLPPLPSKFHDLYASNVRTSTHDDPSLHGGRKRITPHVEGNWPTHVYIEWYSSPTEHTTLSGIISELSDDLTNSQESSELHTVLTSDLGATLPLHISLSRPIGFLTDKKDTYIDSLSQAVGSSAIRPFEVTISGLDWVSNFEKSRWFLVLRVRTPPNNELNRLLHITNEIVQDYDQPPLYASSRPVKSAPRNGKKHLKKDVEAPVTIQDCSNAFHFSIAWSLKKPSEEVEKMTRAKMKEWQDKLRNIRVNISEVKNKVGNVVHSLKLSAQELGGGSLFGL